MPPRRPKFRSFKGCNSVGGFVLFCFEPDHKVVQPSPPLNWKIFRSPKRSAHTHSQSPPFPSPRRPRQPACLRSVSMARVLWKFHVNVITQHLSPRMWLLWLRVSSTSCDKSRLCSFSRSQRSPSYGYTPSFLRASADRHVGCFHFFTITHNK